jgi:hypothetical protein
MKKAFLIIGLGVFCVGAAGVVWNVARSTRETKFALAAIAQQEVAANAKMRRAVDRAIAAEREEASLRAVLTGLQSASAVNPAKPPSPQATSAASAQAVMKKLAEEREHASRPVAQLWELAGQRSKFTLANLPFFDRLKLSPTQVEQCVEIELKRFQTSLDMKPLFNQGLLAGRDDPIAAKLSGDARAEAEAAYRELLGESGYQQFQEFRRTDVARTIVGGIAGVAVVSGAPYTRPQIDQLVQAIADSDSRYLGGQDVQWHTVDWNIADAKLRPLMTDAQWTLFKTADGGWNQHYSRSFCAQENATRAEGAPIKAAQAALTAKHPGG